MSNSHRPYGAEDYTFKDMVDALFTKMRCDHLLNSTPCDRLFWNILESLAALNLNATLAYSCLSDELKQGTRSSLHYLYLLKNISQTLPTEISRVIQELEKQLTPTQENHHDK